MNRYMTKELLAHIQMHRQMAFLSGPRQVGKTTIAKRFCEQLGGPTSYLNWDNQDHRSIILGGPGKVASTLRLDQLR